MQGVVNGDYISRYSIPMQFLISIDILLFSLLYFLVSLVFGAWFNDNIFQGLRRDNSTKVFGEMIGDTAMTIGAIYFITHFMTKIPSIIPNAPVEHYVFRLSGGNVLLAFALVACQLSYLDKLRYLYNEDKDQFQKTTEEILVNWEICQDGSVAPPGDFSCQT